MKCNLNLLKENNIPYSFATLLVGIKSNMLDNTDISNYAVEYLAEHPYETDPLITELTCLNQNTPDIDIWLVKVLNKQLIKLDPGTDAWFTEERKLRLCLLLDLKQNTLNRRELLEKIAEVYADFNYPPNMEEFIYYMPAKNYDPSQYSQEENEQRLLTLFDEFLEKEKNGLQDKTTKPPSK